MWLEAMSFYNSGNQMGATHEESMKFKTLVVVAGTLALSLATTPLVVQAQTKPPAPQKLAQAQKPQGPLQRLNLTEQQKVQIEQVRNNARTEIEKVIRPEQQARFKTAMQNRQGVQAAIAAMNLTSQQQNQIRQIMESSQTKILQDILTAPQRQQLQQIMQSSGQPRNR